jgi:hypothetical protein
MSHNGAVQSGNKRFQRITVGVIIGLVVLSMALTLIGPALAASPTGASRTSASGTLATDDPVTTPSSGASGLVGTDDPRPVTETPQGTSTQVTDEEHIGGLVGFIAFMLGGLLLLIRGKRRERRERAMSGSEPILSGH